MLHIQKSWELPEDGRQLGLKHVGALITNKNIVQQGDVKILRTFTNSIV